MSKPFVDMQRPSMLYGVGVGMLMLLSLAISNVPMLALSQYFEVPFRREVCAGLFMTAALLGAYAFRRHLQRSKTPWKVPQSQISVPYCAFFLVTLAGIVLAK